MAWDQVYKDFTVNANFKTALMRHEVEIRRNAIIKETADTLIKVSIVLFNANNLSFNLSD